MAIIDNIGAVPLFERLISSPSGHKTDRLPLSIIVASISINILGLALPLVILQVYDRVLTNQAYNTLAWLMGGLAVVLVVETFLRVIRSYLLSWSTIKSAYLSDVQAVDGVLALPVHKYDQESAISWMDRFDALEQHNAFASSQSRLALIDIPFFALYLGIIYIVAGELALVVTLMIGIFAFLIFSKISQLRSILDERARLDQRRYDFMGETLSGIESVKAMAMEPQMQRRLERLQKSSAEIAMRKNILSNELTTTTGLMVGVMMVAVVTVGAALVIQGALSIGALACTTLLTSRLAQLTARSIPVLLERQTSEFAMDRASSLLVLQPDIDRPTTEVDQIEGSVQIDDVTFSYDLSAPPLMTVDKLRIAANEVIGIKGGQSTGKSTLLKLIAGELQPQTGHVSIDGIDMQSALQRQLQQHIRFVRNQSHMFQGTILENITMFEGGPAVLRAKSNARLIGLEKAINRLPAGFNTKIGAGASSVLPSGMLQQIMIARALTAEPKILLFDEANSSLDLASDKALIEGLKQLRGQMTQILITNRPSLLQIADRVFEIKDGHLTTSSQANQAPSRSPK